jgi:hypothetical protein
MNGDVDPSSANFWTIQFGSVRRTTMFDCRWSRVSISPKFAAVIGRT